MVIFYRLHEVLVMSLGQVFDPGICESYRFPRPLSGLLRIIDLAEEKRINTSPNQLGNGNALLSRHPLRFKMENGLVEFVERAK